MKLTNAGDFTVKPNWTLGPRVLQDYELVYFPHASQTLYRNEHAVYQISAPTYILTVPGEWHDYRFDPQASTRHWFLHFEAESPQFAIVPGLSGPPEASLVHVEQETTIIPLLMKQVMVLSHAKPVFWRERAQTLLAAILSEFSALLHTATVADVGKTLSSHVSQAIAYMAKHMHDRELTIAQIARQSGWSHAHFTRKFTEETGLSPRDKLREIRIEQACQWLLHKQMSIKEIAYRCGFEDEHYFSRVFSQLKKMTASAYRRKYACSDTYHLMPVETSGGDYPRNQYFLYN